MSQDKEQTSGGNFCEYPAASQLSDWDEFGKARLKFSPVKIAVG
jgi:hypothetical protein